MGRCVVTANAVCDYVKEWLLVVDEESSDMKSHTLTLHDCPYVSNEALEEECERQGLVAIKRTQDDQVNKFPFDIMANGGTHVNYAIRLNKPQQVSYTVLALMMILFSGVQHQSLHNQQSLTMCFQVCGFYFCLNKPL
jgi:hypothetical protein